jgi:hypothetical protein
MQFEANAFDHFYRALKGASVYSAAWDQRGSFVDHLDQLASRYFTDTAERDTYLQSATLIESGRAAELRVDLSHVAALKVSPTSPSFANSNGRPARKPTTTPPSLDGALGSTPESQGVTRYRMTSFGRLLRDARRGGLRHPPS